ncbi:hypothetical protein B0H13DRAFT_2274766 [Mycena leptocephala]|nr:hypothetical protein B0H13DRAFT_2274766 [Mycena leptocephala]
MAAKGDNSVPFGASQSFLALRGAWTSHPPPFLIRLPQLPSRYTSCFYFWSVLPLVTFHPMRATIGVSARQRMTSFIFPRGNYRCSFEVRLSFFAARMTLSSNSDLIIVAEFIEVRDPVAVITSLTRISSASFSSPFGKELGNYHLDCGPIPSSSCKGHAVWFWTVRLVRRRRLPGGVAGAVGDASMLTADVPLSSTPMSLILKSFKDSVLKTPGDSNTRVQVRGSTKIFLKSYYKISTMLPASGPKSGSQSLLTRIEWSL